MKPWPTKLLWQPESLWRKDYSTKPSGSEKTGVGTAIDTERAQVELQNEKQRLIDAGTQKSTAVYVLAQLLDLPGREEPSQPIPCDISTFPNLTGNSSFPKR